MTGTSDSLGRSLPLGGSRIPVLRENRLTALALIASAMGFLTLIPGTPSLVRAILLFTFVAVGPGSALLVTRSIPGISTAFLVPLLGISVVILLTSALAYASWWSPRTSLAVLAAVTAGLALRHVKLLLAELRT
jgi:hypothetical protein